MVFKPELVYCGRQNHSKPDKWDVWRNGYTFLLEKSLKHVQFSLSGFSWGARGAGADQLAFALLLDCLKSRKAALKWYEAFASQFVARFPGQWVLTGAQIEEWYWSASPTVLITERTIHAETTN